MLSATSRRKLYASPSDKYPHIASNGLRVTKRNSQAVTLAWPENDADIVTYTESGVSCMDMETELDSLGNWFEVQMRYGDDESPNPWSTIYKGYGQRCEVDDLIPDSLVFFRMKRNGEKKWGTEIIASTDPPPASTDDLNRAVEMNSEYLVVRILGNTQASHLKKILGAHDKNGMTPLMVACHNGNVQIVKMLLSCGARVNDASTGVKRTPLMFACIQGKLNIVQALDQHRLDWQAKDNSGCNAMHHAINGGNAAIVKLAFAKLGHAHAFEVDHCGWTPLMRAAILSDSLEIVKFLVGKNANLNCVDKTNSKSVLMAAILSKKPEFVKFLLEWGADPFYRNKNGKNCFEVAKGLGYREIAKLVRDKMELLQSTMPRHGSAGFAVPSLNQLPEWDEPKRKEKTLEVDSTISVLHAPPETPKLVTLELSTPDTTSLVSKMDNKLNKYKYRFQSPQQHKPSTSTARSDKSSSSKTSSLQPNPVASTVETKFLLRPGTPKRQT